MSKGELFWVIYAICILFGGWWTWSGRNTGPYGSVGSFLPTAILLFLLGWSEFGFIIR